MKNQQAKNSHSQSKTTAKPDPIFYEIKVQGQLDPQRSSWFEGMTLTHIHNGESGLACTLIAGPVTDQSALHGLLTKIRDLNLTLISVRRFMPRVSATEDVSARPEPREAREGHV